MFKRYISLSVEQTTQIEWLPFSTFSPACGGASKQVSEQDFPDLRQYSTIVGLKKGPCRIDVQSKNFPESHIDWFRLRKLPGLEHRQHTQRSIRRGNCGPAASRAHSKNSRGLEQYLTLIGQEPILYSVSQKVCSEQLLAKEVALHICNMHARFPQTSNNTTKRLAACKLLWPCDEQLLWKIPAASNNTA